MWRTVRTETPAAARAFGFSPAALTLRPNLVLFRSNQARPAITRITSAIINEMTYVGIVVCAPNTGRTL